MLSGSWLLLGGCGLSSGGWGSLLSGGSSLGGDSWLGGGSSGLLSWGLGSLLISWSSNLLLGDWEGSRGTTGSSLLFVKLVSELLLVLLSFFEFSSLLLVVLF